MTGRNAGRRAGRWLALALAACLGFGPGAGSLLAPALRLVLGTGVAAGVVSGLLVPADPAEARRSSSSGGYSRPSSGGSSRTPSFGGSSGSSSGGYSRPSGSGSSSGYSSGSSGGYSGSGSDRGASRGQSRNALDDFFAPAERTPSAGSGSSGSSSSRRRPSSDSYDPYGYYGSRGYRLPDYAYGGRSSFGIFDAVLLWYLLDSLSTPSHAQFFRDNQNDPGYQAWRQEADQRAASDADLRAKLAELDRSIASGSSDPAHAGQLPSDIPDTVGRARDLSGGPGMGTILIVILIGGFIIYMIWRTSRGSGKTGGVPPKMVGGDGSALGSAAAILRNKLSGAVYKPELFRPGMPLALDQTPFILADGKTKVAAPRSAGGGGQVGVEAIGTASDRSGTYHRLYLEDEGAFFQLVLDAQGQPAECRYFSKFDEVQPADRDEWGFWLDKQDGMIGWPEFQTKDGQTYARAWSPGSSRVPPRDLDEQVRTLDGTTDRKLHCMLYARKTGLADPAPETEYLLVTAVDAAGQAFVELHAGIDINPAALSLS